MSGPDEIALLTGGADKPYALGLASALIHRGIRLDFIGSDHVDASELQKTNLVNFLNLRGNQSSRASIFRKCLRMTAYYCRLVRYAAGAHPKVFHILWIGKLEFLERILLVYYKMLGKRLVFTAHNVNARKRDGNDTWFNRACLRFQYRMMDHIFVHTVKMRDELVVEFEVPPGKISVIPFGINSTLPRTLLTAANAKKRLGLEQNTRTILFFGHIAPYKGLEYLVEALTLLARQADDYRVIVAGKPKDCAEYWDEIRKSILAHRIEANVTIHSDFIPDDQVETYFKAADVLVLPYKHIYQSGVLFLSYYFGLPVVAADVGSLREDIIEGKTGFVFRPEDSHHLALTLHHYFNSPLYRRLEHSRELIARHAGARNSWEKASEMIHAVYRKALKDLHACDTAPEKDEVYDA